MKTFGWDICHSCNYRCPYCGFWQNSRSNEKVRTFSEWERIWRRISELYGRCRIYMSGGEPSVYPEFYPLVKMLTGIHHPDICTNLSWDIEKLIPEIPSENLTVSPTYHPSFADFDVFFNKILKIKEYLPDRQVFYVAHPGQIKEMAARSSRFIDADIKLIPLPLRGDGYMINSEEEKKIIEELSPYRGSEKIEYQLQNISPKGRKCRSGMDYAVIRVDGKVDRCSQYNTGSVGDISDEEFRLSEYASECDREYCPIESQWIEENE